MTLREILDYLSDNAKIILYDSNNFKALGEYEWHSDIPDEYLDREIYLIEIDDTKNGFIIDIDTEEEE